MIENVENLVLEYLRRLDKKVDALAADLREARCALSGVVQIILCKPGRSHASGRGAARRDREAA